MSKFDYTFDAAGNILTWQQQADSAAPTVYQYTYDRADQLTAAVNQTTDPTPAVLKRFAYTYDPAGNRTSEQIDDAVTSASYDGLNRLTSQQAGGALVFAGTVSEPAAVTIQGQPAIVDANNRFSASVAAATGTTTIMIAAIDGSGNQSSASFDVDQDTGSKTFTYDANANLTADGTRTFEWDARNQLLAVINGARRSEFSYDGLQRRVRRVEKENGITQSDTKVIWCQHEICEERATDGTTVTRRAFKHGDQTAGIAQFFVSDHLGSIGEVTDSSGALLSRYHYDAWGRRSLASGSDVTNVGFTGHLWQSTGDLWLTQYRGYSPDLARWVSEDPLREQGGLNLFQYSRNRPLVLVDPDGRNPGVIVWGGVWGGARGGAAAGGAMGGAVGAIAGGIAGGIVVGVIASAISWWFGKPDECFKKAKDECITKCQDEIEDTGKFFQCIDQCLEKKGWSNTGQKLN